MHHSKCETCHRSHDCTLRDLVELTRPWVAGAYASASDEWERELAVGRALRGSGDSPGNFYQPTGVWVDEHDRIFVSDMLNGRVAVFQFLGADT